jgi:eukaryotic-like serine/threonine-protein kinase
VSLTLGSRLGPYEISGHLGEGGMGEVYRATDTKLRREVAIKVLPEAFTQDAERLARFEREAQVLAQLHHPHIASIFGLEESSGVRALVMELVEGPTLAERLKDGPLPLDECVSIARQIAEALEEAHEKGIVHRDLKPQNVKAPVDGKVKVLDFGLAKAMDQAATSSGSDPSRSPTLMNSPTLTSVQGTQLGMILGTAAYMAPEQARGGAIDRRADIWAFGVVLYEMLTGLSLFGEGTVSDTLAGVLKTEIKFDKLPASTPPAVRRLIRSCLERNPKARLRDIGDARLALESLGKGDADEPPAGFVPPAGSSLSRRLPWAITFVALAAAVGLGLSHRGTTKSSTRPLTAFGILVPNEYFLTRADTPILDLSADGRTLLFTAEGKERPSVLKRTLDRLEPVRIPGTEGAQEPRLSPDGRWIAFFADGSLKKIALEGGNAVVLADARAPRGVAWAPDGSLLFSPLYNSGLWRVPATGGAPVEVTKLDAAHGERSHRWPQVLPDGRTAIFTIGVVTSPGDYDGGKIDAVRLDTGERKTILEGARMARFTAAGYLVYQHQQTLLAAKFDPAKLELTGTPFTIQDAVGGDTSSGVGFFAVSATGVLAFAPGSAIPDERALTLVDRQGNETELGAAPAAYNTPRFSPDGKKIAVAIGGGASSDDDIYLYDLASRQTQRLTFGQGHGHPIWSRDGKAITYTMGRSGTVGMASKPADGSGGEVALSVDLNSSLGFGDSWLPDGKRLLVTNAGGSLDVSLLDVEHGTLAPVFASPTAAEYAPALSPDDRYVAYTTTESSVDEVFVETFPAGGGKWQVSNHGGMNPVWSRDGRELYYVEEDRLMAVDVDTRGVFRPGIPHALFTGPYDLRTPPVRNFDIGPDGRFILVKRKFLQGMPRELVLLDGWTASDPSMKKGN